MGLGGCLIQREFERWDEMFEERGNGKYVLHGVHRECTPPYLDNKAEVLPMSSIHQ